MSGPYRDALRKGKCVEEYKIVRVLGRGGFGITYLAFDLNLDGPVALKEYFPKEHAVRLPDGRVRAASAASAELFDWGRQRFLDEARAINSFRHPNVVRAHRFFESGGSVYIVMDFVEGEPLDTILKKRGRLTPAEWRPLFDQLLDGLEHVHALNYRHRDIKPANIVIRADDDAPVLIDFGAARVATEERTLTQVLTPEYAPLEQHGKGEREPGPPTDLYALAAVSYRALLGELPPAAPDRAIEDTIARLEQRVAGAERAWLATLDQCLAVYPKDRPQSVASLRQEFRKPSVSPGAPAVRDYRRRFEPAKSGRGKGLVDNLLSPFDDWAVRRWVGPRSSGEVNATVFGPFHRRLRIDLGETPLFAKSVGSLDEGFAWLLDLEGSGAIERAARRRIESERGPRPRSKSPSVPPPKVHAQDPPAPSDPPSLEEDIEELMADPIPWPGSGRGASDGTAGPPALAPPPDERWKPGRVVVCCWYGSILLAPSSGGPPWGLGLMAAFAGGVSVLAAFESGRLRLRGGVMLAVNVALLALLFLAFRERWVWALVVWYLGGGVTLWWVGTRFAWRMPPAKNGG